MKYKTIFSDQQINSLVINNRIIMSAMNLGMSKGGYVSDELVKFYKLRAKNEVGMIIIGGAYLDRQTKTWDGILGIDNSEVMPRLKTFNKTIHKYITKTAIQLLHPGRYALPFFTGRIPFSASNIPSALFPALVPIPMTIDDIDHTLGLYGAAAERARDSGFDAIEIVGAMGYLISQFLSPLTNKRNDRYGGGLKNRIRFPLQIIESIRKRVGRNYPIILRISGDDVMEGGNKIEDYIIVAQEFEKANVDAIHITPGWHESKINNIIMSVPKANYYYLSKKIKDAVTIPVITASRFTDPLEISEVLINGYADCVSIGRPLICDPEFVKKIKTNREKEIRKCIACNQGCFDNMIAFKSITCMQNPDVLGDKKLKKVPSGKKIVIIGAGPAGLEAGRVLKRRGHRVKIFEKNIHLGGNSITAALPPSRLDFRNISSFYENEMKKLNIEIVYNWNNNLDTLFGEKPDIVIIATGGMPCIPKIKGIEYAIPADEVLKNEEQIGKRVIIIGGGGVGCETALYAIKKGAMNPSQFYYNLQNNILPLEDALQASRMNQREVIILEKLAFVGRGMGRSTKWCLLRELEECGVVCHTGVDIKEIFRIRDEIVVTTVIKKTNPITKKSFLQEKKFITDTLINACGTVPNDRLYNKLKNKLPKIYKIGDADKTGNCMDAIHAGFELGYTL